VTSGRAPERHGLTVTAASSLCVDPSTVMICVNKSAGAHDTIVEDQVLRLECTDRWPCRPRAKVCWNGREQGRGPLQRWPVDRNGDWAVPILIGSLCSFDCRVIGMHPVATHTVVLWSSVR